MLAWLLLALTAGSGVYCLLVLEAARRYLAARRIAPASFPLISILKPLAGNDEGLQANLRSFFLQDYPHFEILAAVCTRSDPAAAVFARLQQQFPAIPSRLLVVGESPYPNAKVWSLQNMTEQAAHELLVMSDSDIRVTPEMLRTLAAEFAQEAVGVSTCPYRAIGGSGLPSRLEAAGMNTEFLSGVLVARMLEGMRFALGPTIAARKQTICDAGGWPYLAEFLAEDFVLGNRAAEKGWTVLLSSYIIEHRIGNQRFLANAKHRLRWFRSTRRSRPAGYVGQLFTNPLPLTVLLWALRPDWWPFILPMLALRAAAAWATSYWVVRNPVTVQQLWLIPVQDVLSFVFWIGGFFGNTVQWRGRRFHLHRDGRFTVLPDTHNKGGTQYAR